MGFKENLKSELEYQGMLIKELSAKCGISRNTVNNYLTGHNSLPTADTAVKIAQALGVTVEYLVNGSDSVRNENTSINEIYDNYKIIDHTKYTDVYTVEDLGND